VTPPLFLQSYGFRLVAATFLPGPQELNCTRDRQCSYRYWPLSNSKVYFIILWQTDSVGVAVLFHFESDFVPVERSGRIYLLSTRKYLYTFLHLTQLRASSFRKPIPLISSSTCLLHVFRSRLRFLWPSILKLSALLDASSSSLLKTCPYHRTLLAFAKLSTISLNTSMFINSSVFFSSTSFAPHVALTVDIVFNPCWHIQLSCVLILCSWIMHCCCWTYRNYLQEIGTVVKLSRRKIPSRKQAVNTFYTFFVWAKT